MSIDTEPPIVHGLELADTRTHKERINDEDPVMDENEVAEHTTDGRTLTVKDVRKRSDPAPTEWAHADHPMGERWPYMTTLKSVNAASVPLPPGSLVELLPHEVGKHHVLAKRVLDDRAAATEPVVAEAEGEQQAQ